MRRRGEVPAEEKYGAGGFGASFGTSSIGQSDDSFALFTPHRKGPSAGDELSRSHSTFDAQLQSGGRNPFQATAEASMGGGAGFGFGERSGSSFGERSGSSFGGFGTSSFGAGGRAGSTFAPRSLMDASKGARAAQEAAAQQQQTASHFSPVQTSTRVLRSGGGVFAGGPSAGIPSQSLRDSPFMRAPAPTTAAASAASSTPAAAATRNVMSTPAGASSTAASAAARQSTPFDTEASPVRPGAFTAAVAAAAKQRNDSAEEEDEHKESSLIPADIASDGASWRATGPFGSSLSAGPLAPIARPTGLGYLPVSDPCSVTVFGFCAADTARVLQRFASFGEVVSREDGAADLAAGMDDVGAAVGSSAANWLHLTYRSAVAAAAAQAMNGRIIIGARGQSVMIGVKPRTRAIDAACDGVPGLSGVASSSHAAHERHGGSIFERSARKAAAAQTLQRAHEQSAAAGALTAASIYAAPQATNPGNLHKSFCTKLMEYLFNY